MNGRRETDCLGHSARLTEGTGMDIVPAFIIDAPRIIASPITNERAGFSSLCIEESSLSSSDDDVGFAELLVAVGDAVTSVEDIQYVDYIRRVRLLYYISRLWCFWGAGLGDGKVKAIHCAHSQRRQSNGTADMIIGRRLSA